MSQGIGLKIPSLASQTKRYQTILSAAILLAEVVGWERIYFLRGGRGVTYSGQKLARPTAALTRSARQDQLPQLQIVRSPPKTREFTWIIRCTQHSFYSRLTCSTTQHRQYTPIYCTLYGSARARARSFSLEQLLVSCSQTTKARDELPRFELHRPSSNGQRLQIGELSLYYLLTLKRPEWLGSSHMLRLVHTSQGSQHS